ncbi:MAG TPA: preprotein translocase subunit SecG [Verrucomicrobiae bacterium]|nr:preprotein translocase subunit SecG [Verrucomicrobiae bacterium]
MSFIVGILIFLMAINCLLLILLILVQLPKKDAGAGLAFGGGAADALFGAGSGTTLTKITKWTAVVFFGLALILGHEQNVLSSGGSSGFLQKMQEQQSQPPPAPVIPQQQPSQSTTQPAVPSTSATSNLLALPLTTGSSNLPAAPAH